MRSAPLVPSVPTSAALALGLLLSLPATADVPPDRAVDAAPFGAVQRWQADGTDLGVVWEDPRDLFRVVIEFGDGVEPPPPDTLRLQYWQSVWPEQRIPRDRPWGAGLSGWTDVGDWFRGEWRDADVDREVAGSRLTFRFRPLNEREFPELADLPVRYRTTLKVRVVADAALPRIDRFAAFTDSVWETLELAIEWGGTAKTRQVWDGRLTAFNGHLEHVAPLDAGSGVRIAADRSWRSRVRGRTDGVRATVRYAKPAGFNSLDGTVITVRAEQAAFSFSPADLLERGPIFLPDYGVLVRRADSEATYAAAEAEWRGRPDEQRDLYTRVTAQDEQSFESSWGDMPEKLRHYIPLGFEGARQHFGVTEGGNLFLDKTWLQNFPGRDSERCLWDEPRLEIDILPRARPGARAPVDGYLPLMTGSWERRGVRYTQTVFVLPRDGLPEDDRPLAADDPLVLLMRIVMSRVADDYEGGAQGQAVLDFVTRDGKRAESLALRDGRVVALAAGGAERTRLLVRTADPRGSFTLEQRGGRVGYRADLAADPTQRTVEVIVPYETPTTPEEWERLAALDFERSFASVREYWTRRLAAGAQLRTPVPMINDFYRAHAGHLLLNTEREVGRPEHFVAKVGTFVYGAYSNESCMMIADLDRRGYTQRAERALQTWLDYQGTVGLPGDFTDQRGVFYGAGGYEQGGYNQHHGWVLWCLAEHYRYTRDDAWLARVAPQIVEGCDWITRQRARMTELAGRDPLRAIERGLLPPGQLEDIGDWRSWLSTNVYSWWGLKHAADVLGEAGHPEAGRLRREAASYRRDILEAFDEAMRRSPVVRLRDGRWVPHIPSDVHRRGRSFGWITETLEGAIHLVITGALEPRDPRATWILQDYEDNLYLSERFGYDLRGEEFERYWFGRGGITMQANLLAGPIAYLRRDEIKHFLRGYFNAFSASYFPDTRMMTEHALPSFGGWAGDHYKTSDESNSAYWLRLMYVEERGDELRLGGALPRSWLVDGSDIAIERARTHFGTLSLRIVSRAAAGAIEMTIDPPRRNPPRSIRARFRHPAGRPILRCEVDGRPWRRFDPSTGWVDLGRRTAPLSVVAYYD